MQKLYRTIPVIDQTSSSDTAFSFKTPFTSTSSAFLDEGASCKTSHAINSLEPICMAVKTVKVWTIPYPACSNSNTAAVCAISSSPRSSSKVSLRSSFIRMALQRRWRLLDHAPASHALYQVAYIRCSHCAICPTGSTFESWHVLFVLHASYIVRLTFIDISA